MMAHKEEDFHHVKTVSLRSFRIVDNKITITKKQLEEWRDYYFQQDEAQNQAGRHDLSRYYAGKAGTLIDLLSHFES